MSAYFERFNSIAVSQARDEFSEVEANFWIPINPLVNQDVDMALQVCRKQFKDMAILRQDMANLCFSRVTDASFALCCNGIRHSVTIGDVRISGKPKYRATAESIRDEMEMGYLHGMPAYAHSWITLENGVILDFTILYTLAKQAKRKPPKLIQGIYRSDQPSNLNLEYIPLSLGPFYHMKVVVMPNAAAFDEYYQWLVLIGDLLSE